MIDTVTFGFLNIIRFSQHYIFFSTLYENVLQNVLSLAISLECIQSDKLPTSPAAMGPKKEKQGPPKEKKALHM